MQYKIPEALDAILDYQVWRANNLPCKMTRNVVTVLEHGFAYVHGRAKNFRPIIVMKPSVEKKIIAAIGNKQEA